MKVRIAGPQHVNGTIQPPPSKAYTHRALIASLLSSGITSIENPLRCDDTNRTLDAIQAFGANVSISGDRAKVSGRGSLSPPREPISCGESGATLRFLTAVSACSPQKVLLAANRSLSSRPLLPLVEALKNLGARVLVQQDKTSVEVEVRGPLTGGSATVPGDVSSQFISGLLLAAPLSLKDVNILVEGKVESRPYVEMTLEVLRKHGVRIESSSRGFRIAAPQAYQPAFHHVPSDFSSAAFLIAAAATAGEELTIPRLAGPSIEPDSIILELLSRMGARLERRGNSLRVIRSELNGFEFDATDHPDLVPVLEVLACQARGTSQIRGAGRLRLKESNRLQTLPEEMGKMGAKIATNDDTVLIKGPQELSGGELYSHQDHRVAMACATASLTAKGTTTIDGAEATSKSYPDFFNDLGKLGVRVDVE